MGPKSSRGVEVEFRIARCLEELDQPVPAAEAFAKFAGNHPQSSLCDEARYRWGGCLLAKGQAAPARRVWQELFARPGDAASPWMAEAAYRLAETWGFPHPPDDASLALGVDALDQFLARFPRHAHAGAACLQAVQGYVQRGQFGEAVTRLDEQDVVEQQGT